jgi:HD-GYP domain-containing protein (c-di-GMP phosphodiesterase class II)
METYNENKAVGQLSEILALKYGFGTAKARQIRNAAVMHDIGKLLIPKSIIDKPGKLNSQEFEIIKTHTKLGADLLSSIKGEMGEVARACCLLHHERADGNGYWNYPADNLPDYIPIVSISDVFCSLVSKRPYKNAWSSEDALSYIHSNAGTQFSADLVEDFIQ